METRSGISFQEAQEIAHSFPSESLLGIVEAVTKVYSWNGWPVAKVKGQGHVVMVDGATVAVFWLEPDDFNSECLNTSVARLHWRLNPAVLQCHHYFKQIAHYLSEKLDQSAHNLVGLQVLGQDVRALTFFQSVGCKYIVSNAWLYRLPSEAPYCADAK